MASRFGEMLLNRRRELGLSIQQVANVIKIRPQIIEFYETGNFASMPPRGYAQGMIASYARYLGLNPREVVNAYFDELYVYERGGSAAGSQFTEGATNPVPRSASLSGRYLMVDPPPAPSSRYGQRPPQAGYVSDSTSGHVPLRVADNQRRAANMPLDSERGRGGYGDGPRGSYGAPEGGGDRAGRTVQMRRPGGYRGSADVSRGSGAPARAQRSGSRPSGSGRGGRRPPRRGSAPQRGLLDDPRVLLAGLGLIVVLIILVIILLVRSCSPAPAETGSASVNAAVTESEQKSETQDGTETDAGDDTSDGSESADDSASSDEDATGDGSSTDPNSASAETVETQVTISIPEGVTSWLEVYVDGTSVYAAQTAGPFEKTYTPTDSIEITVDHPGDVKITKNGESVDWDTRTSGVGRVTISVPKPATTATDAQAATDGTASDGAATDSAATDGAASDDAAAAE